ncbi:MAG TPA: flagellar accessory protein FlaH [Methanosarcinales archaeon]|nr:flagellar accessory protein FlaH [Methanosarcinales archaeon]
MAEAASASTDDSDEEIFTDDVVKEKIVSSGNTEIDRKLGGGIPVGSLTMIEGDNDTGKSVLIQQIMWGALNQGHKVVCYTTENTIKSLLNQMESLALDISDFFMFGNLKIYPIHTEGLEWDSQETENLLQAILDSIKHNPQNVIILDSLTVFVTHSSENAILDFFSRCKNLCDQGKTIIITGHRYAFNAETLIRIMSICDGHIELVIKEVGEKLLKTMKVSKMRGAQLSTGNIVSFDVIPGFGLRIIPISAAKV